MSKDIRIKKGLDINLVGEASLTKSDAIKSNFFSIKPEDFHGLTPKLLVKKASKDNAGEPIFYAKSNESIQCNQYAMSRRGPRPWQQQGSPRPHGGR